MALKKANLMAFLIPISATAHEENQVELEGIFA
jgi:hypothetical protein